MITIELAQAINEDRKRVFGSYAFAPDMVTQVLRIRAELEQEINADTRKNASPRQWSDVRVIEYGSQITLLI